MRLPRPDPDELKRLYLDEGHTIAAIAAILGVAHGTGHNWLRQAGIERRPTPFAARGDIDDDQIRSLYLDQELSAAQIAGRLHCGTSTIYARLDRLGIDRRDLPPTKSVPPKTTCAASTSTRACGASPTSMV
jgi:transposase